MTRDDILASLFNGNYRITTSESISSERGTLPGGQTVHILGLGEGELLGVEKAIELAHMLLDIVGSGERAPILMLVDTGSQRMSRHDELLGLNEYLVHLAKSLRLAGQAGFKTIGLIYGGSTAGAFIATALACDILVALPDAHPEVMDLPSMARVTKLPLETLKAKAETSAVFAPGLDNMVKTGGVSGVWNPARPLSTQLETLLTTWKDADTRSELGDIRGGRPAAFDVAKEIVNLALAHE